MDAFRSNAGLSGIRAVDAAGNRMVVTAVYGDKQSADPSSQNLVESETVLRISSQKNLSYVKARLLGDTFLKEQKTVHACHVMHELCSRLRPFRDLNKVM